MTDSTKNIIEKFDSEQELYFDFTNKVHLLISDLLEESGVRVHSVTCRIKDKNSLLKKLAKPGHSYVHLSDVTDIAGIRITTFFADEVDRVAKLIEEEFAIDLVNSTDKRAALDPDRFGYLSLHHVASLADERTNLTEYRRFNNLKVEIQTRSILQHAWAEIEHDLGYKTALGIPNEIRRRFSRLAGLPELADSEFVAIRDALTTYEDTISEKIERIPQLVEINKASLESFVMNSEVVRRIDEAIARINGGTVEDVGSKYVEVEIPRLARLGFDSIGELENSIAKHEALVIAFAERWLRDADRGLEFAKGVTLLYFEYVIVAEAHDKTLPKELFESGIGLREEREQLAEKVIATYQAVSG